MDGILFTCGQPMSKLVPEFLNACTYKTLIIVDDELDFLEQLMRALGENRAIGYHYRRKIPSNFNAYTGEKQLLHFQKTRKLLANDEA